MNMKAKRDGLYIDDVKYLFDDETLFECEYTGRDPNLPMTYEYRITAKLNDKGEVYLRRNWTSILNTGSGEEDRYLLDVSIETVPSAEDAYRSMKYSFDIDKDVLEDIDFLGFTCGSAEFEDFPEFALLVKDKPKLATYPGSAWESRVYEVLSSTTERNRITEARYWSYYAGPLYDD